MADLRKFWARVREEEAALRQAFGETVVLKSLETPNGAVAGCFCEVDPAVAARFIVEQSHERTSTAEAAVFRKAREAARQRALAEQRAKQLQVAILQGAEGELRVINPQSEPWPVTGQGRNPKSTTKE